MIRAITIRFEDSHGLGRGFDVADDTGRVADGLTFDEMLGQLVSLAHPDLRTNAPRYGMQTPAQHDQRKREREAQQVESEARRRYAPQRVIMPDASAVCMAGDGAWLNNPPRGEKV